MDLILNRKSIEKFWVLESDKVYKFGNFRGDLVEFEA